MTKAEVGMRGHESRRAGSLWKLEKTRKRTLS